MNIPNEHQKFHSNWVRFGAVGFTLTILSFLLSMGGCSQVEGSRCDPALSHDECDNAPTVQCVTPSGQGNSYCCTVTAGATTGQSNPGVLNGGTIDSTDPNCQSVPAGGFTCPLGTPFYDPTTKTCSDVAPTTPAVTTDDGGEEAATTMEEASTTVDATTPVEASVVPEAGSSDATGQ